MITDIHTHHPSDSVLTLRTVGIHPWQALEVNIAAMPADEAAAADAIGEIGLDYACDTPRRVQMSIFVAQLELAERLGKPVVIHCVRAFEDVMKALSKHHLRAVIFHGFIGSVEQAQRAVAQGYYLSFGERTFRSPKSIAALRVTPLSQLFVESDESRTPIGQIYEGIAALLTISADHLMQITHENFERVTRR